MTVQLPDVGTRLCTLHTLNSMTRFYVTTLKPKPSFTSDDLINAELPRSSVHCPHEIKVDKAQIDNALLDVSQCHIVKLKCIYHDFKWIMKWFRVNVLELWVHVAWGLTRLLLKVSLLFKRLNIQKGTISQIASYRSTAFKLLFIIYNLYH